MKTPRGLPTAERQADFPRLYEAIRRELDRRPGWSVHEVLAGERVAIDERQARKPKRVAKRDGSPLLALG